MQLKSLIVLGTALVVASGARVRFLQCEDGSLCPDGATCCKIDDEAWGCCPYEFGQCCEDGRHCCPTGYSCDGANSSCTHKVTQKRLFGTVLERVPPLARDQRDQVSGESSVGNIRCPDGNYCLDGQTCCLLASGHYGCCPYQHAECCSDHSSCCPEGYKCRVSTHQCVQATTNHTVAMVKKVDPIVPALTSVASLRNELFVKNIRCPDGNYCNDGQTCCLLTSGQYGCCPYAHAQCCSDHESCCPEGYICKVSTRQCLHAASNHTMPMVQKVQPVLLSSATPEVTGELIRCPDGAYCQDTQTCCLQKSGRYGCCPYVHAQCCSDHASCCPEGFRCKVSTRQCIHATRNHTVAMLEKVDSIVPELVELPLQKSDGVTCPDGHKCLNGQTCCQLTSGKYGCCPLPEAVCCPDHLTCCPKGYQCHVATQTCTLADHTVPAVRKLSSFMNAALIEVAESPVGNVRCPDGSYCLDGQTCCVLASGHYGCCPYQHAECCSDHSSCCPEGYQCRVSTHQCVHATTNHTVAMVKKVDPVVPALRSVASLRNELSVQKIRCPDGNYCNDGQTCCLLTSGQYGCCPYAHAQCCSDHTSCCPEGYICKVSTRQCLHKASNHTMPMVQKVQPVLLSAATPEVTVPNQLCPDGNECEDDQTCCLLQSGSYGCCPYNQAVCCDDKEHCCPAGYTCDVQAARCIKGDLSSPLMRPLVPKRRSRLTNTILVDEVKTTCPDQSTCPDKMTCCQSKNSTYVCCPFDKATCCKDGEHCCPGGYQCDEARRMCTRKLRPEDVPALNEFPSDANL
ncbi:progranulin-like isoform X2 [Dermacentor albipictus]|uniref:progranulin-like isoform X2 n=1 Tax=Dermacentor albipictus TaxID=60249 RepID=UPI0031FC3AC3